MAAADDEADALARNEGDAQEAAGTTCAFSYLFFPAFKWICECVLNYTQSLLQIVCTYKLNLFDGVDQGMFKYDTDAETCANMLNRELNHKHATIWCYSINRDATQSKKKCVPIKTSRICLPVNTNANL